MLHHARGAAMHELQCVRRSGGAVRGVRLARTRDTRACATPDDVSVWLGYHHRRSATQAEVTVSLVLEPLEPTLCPLHASCKRKRADSVKQCFKMERDIVNE